METLQRCPMHYGAVAGYGLCLFHQEILTEEESLRAEAKAKADAETESDDAETDGANIPDGDSIIEVNTNVNADQKNRIIRIDDAVTTTTESTATVTAADTAVVMDSAEDISIIVSDMKIDTITTDTHVDEAGASATATEPTDPVVAVAASTIVDPMTTGAYLTLARYMQLHTTANNASSPVLYDTELLYRTAVENVTDDVDTIPMETSPIPSILKSLSSPHSHDVLTHVLRLNPWTAHMSTLIQYNNKSKDKNHNNNNSSK